MCIFVHARKLIVLHICLCNYNVKHTVRKLIHYSNKTYLMVISIYAYFIGSILNTVAHVFCQFFCNVTIVVNGKVGFLNIRWCMNWPLLQTKDSTLINDICT